MRLLGLDIGTKTIGVAASDELGLTAQPIETIRYSKELQAFHRIVELVRTREIEALVVGLPLHLNGDEGPQVDAVKGLVNKLQAFLARRGHEVKVIYWDERLSTWQAGQELKKARVSREERDQVIDTVAACLILQGYLDAK